MTSLTSACRALSLAQLLVLAMQFALKSLKKPVIPVIVGDSDEWRETAIGLLLSNLVRPCHAHTRARVHASLCVCVHVCACLCLCLCVCLH